MTVSRTTELDTVTITNIPVKGVLIRFRLNVVDGDEVLASKFARTSIDDGADIQASLSGFFDGIVELGYPSPSESQINQINDVVRLAWPEHD